jgi:hypothetical protein
MTTATPEPTSAPTRGSQFRLRTLLILMAVPPPLLAVVWLWWHASTKVEHAHLDSSLEIIWDDYAPGILPPQKH